MCTKVHAGYIHDEGGNSIFLKGHKRMQTREDLLNGLSDAASIIKQLADIQTRLRRVRNAYRYTMANKKMGILAKIVIGLFALEAVYALIRFNIWGVIISVFEIGVIYAVVQFYYKMKNKKIDTYNQQVFEHNEHNKIKEQEVLNDLQRIQIAYRERLSSWYPDNYCSVEAAEFFYNAIKNYRADSLKEAINIYETTLHQRRVENNQKKAIEQQKLNNLLAAGSLVMQGAALGEMSRHNATQEFAMQNANRTLNDIRSRL